MNKNDFVNDGVDACSDDASKIRKVRAAKTAHEKTLVGLAVVVDDGWYYAIPKNQKLGEEWDKTNCTWMSAEPSIHMAHPQEGSDVRWFRHNTAESSVVHSFARFGIVTFYGAPDPQNDAFTQRTVWAVSTSDDNAMKDLYDAFLAAEAESQAKQEPSVKQQQSGTTQPVVPELSGTQERVVTSPAELLQELERPVVGAFGDGEYILLTKLPKDRNTPTDVTGQRCVAVCNVPGVDVHRLFAVSNETHEVRVDKEVATEVVDWEGSWTLPGGAACKVCSTTKPLPPVVRSGIGAPVEKAPASGKNAKPKRQPMKRTRKEEATEVTPRAATAPALVAAASRPAKAAALPSQPALTAYRVGDGNAWTSTPPDGSTTAPPIDQLMQSHSVKQVAAQVSPQTDNATLQTVVLPSGHVATVKTEALRTTAVPAPPPTAASSDDDAMRQRMIRAMAVAKASQAKLATSGAAAAPK